mgnify:CR=1 FL=1
MRGGISMMMVLRAHHLLCAQGFQGMGYSSGFVKEFSKIVEKIRDEEQDFSIQVIAGLDDACQYCPNKGEDKCLADEASNEQVLIMDLRVISHLGLIEGASYPKSYLLRLIAKEISPDDLDYLCRNCSWLKFGVCKEGIARLREKYAGEYVSNLE